MSDMLLPGDWAFSPRACAATGPAGSNARLGHGISLTLFDYLYANIEREAKFSRYTGNFYIDLSKVGRAATMK